MCPLTAKKVIKACVVLHTFLCKRD